MATTKKTTTTDKAKIMEEQAQVRMHGTESGAYEGQSHVSGFHVVRADGAIFEPSLDPTFYVTDDHQDMLENLNVLAQNSPQNIILTGPQGCGKTELGIYFAAKYKRPCFIMNCAAVRETKDWYGYRDAKDGTLFWHKAEFVRAVEMGHCVVLIDEINRIHTTLTNSLYPLLDQRRKTYIEEIGNFVVVGPDTVFFATANIGFSHTGTHQLDSAFEDRFAYRIDIDFPSEQKETEIIVNKTGLNPQLSRKLAKFGADVRRKAIGNAVVLNRAVSTRQLLHSAVLMREYEKKKRPVAKALDYTVLPYYSREGGRESEQAQVRLVIQGLFGE
jgi:nitric oxide reductase NorQ protein